ncbi:MAG TPA: alpha/beta hydrolase family protein [Mycobacteriales bacterium]|nr:alpha/beta hydrolase family protein [Mycobacteriales bacterium]
MAARPLLWASAAVAAVAAAVMTSTALPVVAAPRTDQAGGTRSVKVVDVVRKGSRVVELTIRTPAFATPTKVDVDLPVGYRSHPHKRWPVTYFLAGIMNTYASLNHVVDGVKLTSHFPAISVSPNGDSGWWSDWYNSGAGGAPEYETYVVDQLIPLIDKRFRTIPRRSERAVIGVSMGGYGAMMLAARHPDLFGEAASLSGAVNTSFQPIATVLSASPTFQGGAVDAIYGSQATQEIRWHGHNPTDLASNLRETRLQVRTANGFPNPGIGETLLSADTPSCLIEAGVHQGSLDFTRKLNALHIPHLWEDYGPGCHTPQNFEREITDTLSVLAKQFADPAAQPSSFTYRSIEPRFGIYGWHVAADPRRALEFLELHVTGHRHLMLAGSGTTTITTPRWFSGGRRVVLRGAMQRQAPVDRRGRATFTVDLGAPDRNQQYTAGATTSTVRRTVAIAPSRE